ncbi:unnamed protein product [Phytophthora fragariaefolia]|uniref:Unnamed protein product n=1 Tax=Phytophthora fragariaefolia TaxID=1490495 RepID=A0A9W6TW12_9STRA|nr:unnamed protein product [Phytophthora fragariaefolia]
MELVSSELKRRRPDGSGQDKGKCEKVYAAVEAKPIGGIVERNTTRKTPRDMITVIVTTKATRTDVVTTDVLPHVDIQGTSGHSGAHEGDRGRQGYGGHDDHRGPPAGYRPRSPHYDSEPREYGYGGSAPPYFNQSRGSGYHSSPPRDERHYGYQSPRFDDRGYQPQPFAGPPHLVTNVDHHLGVDIRRHVGGRIARRHEDALVHEEAKTISMAVAILMNDVVVHVIVMVIDHHTEGTLLEALTFQKEVDTKDLNPVGKQTENVAAHVREKGMACIRRGDGTYGYKFERNRASNFGAEADNDEDGSSGVLVIPREDIIENINKNPKMTRTEKRLTRASVK